MSLRTKTLTGVAAASIAIATPTISSWEGFRGKPYRDIGGVWTVCYGETDNVDPSKIYTKAECDEMLAARVPHYYKGAMSKVRIDIPITMRASITSFTYNIGISAFHKSTMLRKINEGRLEEACQELDRWSYVGSMWVKGLNNRRKAEYKLCTAELPVRTKHVAIN